MSAASPNYPEMPDGELVELAKARDRNAFGALLNRYWEMSERVAYRLAGEDGKDDVLQNARMRAWESLPGFRGDSRFMTWFCTILVNEARTYHRDRVTHGMTEVPRNAENRDKGIGSLDSISEDVDDLLPCPPNRTEIEADARQESLHECLEALKRTHPKHARLLQLKYWDGMKQGEIAKQEKMSDPRVSVRLDQGRELIKTCLKNKGFA